MTNVSVLIPSDDGDQYLLKAVQGRGWWLIHDCVGADCTAKSTAQRIATEVGFHYYCFYRATLLQSAVLLLAVAISLVHCIDT